MLLVLCAPSRVLLCCGGCVISRFHAATELGRVSERLAGVEGQVASLEERRAAAEAHLHRTQVEKAEYKRSVWCCCCLRARGTACGLCGWKLFKVIQCVPSTTFTCRMDSSSSSALL
jgi:hypothetical protein